MRDVSDGYALLAVQGPRSLERLDLPEATAFTFARARSAASRAWSTAPATPARWASSCMCEADDAPALWDAVVERGAVACGLGARDTLRLEVCYPLHGNDIGPDTDPVSAGLGWTCALDKEFTGAEISGASARAGPERRLVPFVMEEKAIPRAGMAIEGGGTVTSGTHSPMLDRGIGMGYVPTAQAEPGTSSRSTCAASRAPRRVVRKPIYKKEELVAAAESYPEDLRYHREHDWARVDGDEATLGITWFAAGRARRPRPLRGARGGREGHEGPVVRRGGVRQGGVGRDLAALRRGRRGQRDGRRAPETVNEDPYGEGWLIRIRLADPSEVDALLDVEAYRALLAEQ